MTKLPNKYGYQPRDEWEARDLDAEADALRNSKGGRCIAVLVALIGVALALPVWAVLQ